jgi:hypothetical protein
MGWAYSGIKWIFCGNFRQRMKHKCFMRHQKQRNSQNSASTHYQSSCPIEAKINVWRRLATCRHIQLPSPSYSPWSRHRRNHRPPCRYIPRRPAIARFSFSCEEKYSPLLTIGAATAVATHPRSLLVLYNSALPAAAPAHSFTLAPASKQATTRRPAALSVRRPKRFSPVHAQLLVLD